MTNRAETAPDDPLRLKDAAAHFGLSMAALRAEAKRGRLTMWRVGGKDWTSISEVQRMFARCRVGPKEQDSGYGQLAPDIAPSGSSKTADINAALAAARLRLQKLSAN